MSLLVFDQVSGGYGEGDILSGISFHVAADEIVVIAGPNGAGKSTVLKAIVGLLTVRAGSILFDGRDITGTRADRIVQSGICYVPQTENVFPTLTVEENLEMGAFLRRDDIAAAKERMFHLFPPLRDKRRQMAGTLSGGQRQMAAIGRALMLDPKLLLLDEPTAGLSPKFADELLTTVKRVNADGIGVLIVEQNVRQALAIADRGYILANGRNRHDDTARNLLADREVARMFLGQ